MDLERVDNISFQNNVLIFFDATPRLLSYEILQLFRIIEFLKLKNLSIHCIPVLQNNSQDLNNDEFLTDIYHHLKQYFPVLILNNLKEIQTKKNSRNEILLLHPKFFAFKWYYISTINYDNYIINSFNFIHSFKQDPHFKTIEIKKFSLSFYMYETLELLKQFQNSKAKPKIGIFGGIHVKETIEFLDKCVKNFQSILFGGSIGTTALKANGLNIGNSTYQKDEVSSIFQFMQKANFEECSVELPVDHIITEQISPKPKTKASSREIPSPFVAIDIGSKTIQIYEQIIKQANLILFHAPLGMIELEKGTKGTLELVKLIQKLKKSAIITGSELCRFIHTQIPINHEIKLVPNFDFINRFLNQNTSLLHNFFS